MGDEELNFTEDEARCWADDPRNQASRKNLVWSAVLVLVLFGIALIAVAWLASSGAPESHGPALSLRSAPVTSSGSVVRTPAAGRGWRLDALSGPGRSVPETGGL